MHLSVPNSVFQPRRALIRYAFIVSARVFLERIEPYMHFPLPSPTFPSAISARVIFLERAIHAFFRSVPNFSKRVLICVYYFGSRVERVEPELTGLRTSQ